MAFAKELLPPLVRSTLHLPARLHGVRVLVIEAGAPMTEAQALARHATPDLTLNIYARAREERLAEIAEKVGENAHFEPKGHTSTARIQVTDRSQHRRRLGDTARKSSQTKSLSYVEEWWRRRESNPRPEVRPCVLLHA